jgi:hypothetical protein
MTNTGSYDSAVRQLRGILATACHDEELAGLINGRDEVLGRFQPIFAVDHLPDLQEGEIKEFLQFKNNHHWSSLHRMGPTVCSDMPRLRQALTILLDESQPLQDRYDQLIPPSRKAFIPRLGRAIMTPILLVAHPDKYGVLNGTTKGGMQRLHLWPQFERGASFSDRYITINKILLQLAGDLGTDLWTLDALWWRVVKLREEVEPSPGEDVEPRSGEEEQSFGLERHLHNFLADNWGGIPGLGSEWDLYEEDGEVVGYEYDTGEVGRIDLLAKHKTEPRWLVIELKRNQSSDQTVGQVLRYMGWVKARMAEPAEEVEGLVIAHEADATIRYALTAVNNVRLRLYNVDFRLREDG